MNVSDRMLQPLTDCFSTEVAARVIESQIDSATQNRIDELARKANDGSLSEEERSEYSEFVEYIDLLGIIKAKARLKLKNSSD